LDINHHPSSVIIGPLSVLAHEVLTQFIQSLLDSYPGRYHPSICRSANKHFCCIHQSLRWEDLGLSCLISMWWCCA